MLDNRASSGGSIFRLTAVLIIVAIFAVIMAPWFRRIPTVEVIDCSLTSATVANNGLTSITITVKNNDRNNSHGIRVALSSHQLVIFMFGSQELPKDDDAWYYVETLNPSASHAQVVNVKASLENGIAKIDYRITVNFYMDGELFDTRKLGLTVQSP